MKQMGNVEVNSILIFYVQLRYDKNTTHYCNRSPDKNTASEERMVRSRNIVWLRDLFDSFISDTISGRSQCFTSKSSYVCSMSKIIAHSSIATKTAQTEGSSHVDYEPPHYGMDESLFEYGKMKTIEGRKRRKPEHENSHIALH